jgi:hypothetical protein
MLQQDQRYPIVGPTGIPVTVVDAVGGADSFVPKLVIRLRHRCSPLLSSGWYKSKSGMLSRAGANESSSASW